MAMPPARSRFRKTAAHFGPGLRRVAIGEEMKLVETANHAELVADATLGFPRLTSASIPEDANVSMAPGFMAAMRFQKTKLLLCRIGMLAGGVVRPVCHNPRMESNSK
jgi:hypothetical protein